MNHFVVLIDGAGSRDWTWGELWFALCNMPLSVTIKGHKRVDGDLHVKISDAEMTVSREAFDLLVGWNFLSQGAPWSYKQTDIPTFLRVVTPGVELSVEQSQTPTTYARIRWSSEARNHGVYLHNSHFKLLRAANLVMPHVKKGMYYVPIWWDALLVGIPPAQ